MITKMLQIQKVILSYSICFRFPRECFTHELMVWDSMFLSNVLQPGTKDQSSLSTMFEYFQVSSSATFGPFFRIIEFLCLKELRDNKIKSLQFGVQSLASEVSIPQFVHSY